MWQHMSMQMHCMQLGCACIYVGIGHSMLPEHITILLPIVIDCDRYCCSRICCVKYDMIIMILYVKTSALHSTRSYLRVKNC